MLSYRCLLLIVSCFALLNLSGFAVLAAPTCSNPSVELDVAKKRKPAKSKSCGEEGEKDLRAVAYMRTSSGANVGEAKDSVSRQWSAISEYNFANITQ